MNLGRWRVLAAAGAALTLLTAAGTLHAQGVISGRVTAETGGAPIPDARILVIGTSVSGTTGADGKYTLRNVPAGTAQMQVLRVGYQSQRRSVQVTAGQTTTADFSLGIAVAQLEQIVTTATGQQRRVELGNAISTLGDVGKAVENTEVASAADLMTAKAPGVIVLPASTLGGAPTVRVRGVSSISLSNSPIYVIDGVRIATNSLSSGTNTQFSLLNDINPEDIEDIEIVKGPSAATLYGTDAANGVVVITTKKGKAGASRWNFSLEDGNVDDRTSYPDMYANWGHTLANPGTAVRCQLATMAPPGSTPSSSSQCISDSVTHYNLLADPSRTFIHMGNRKLGSAQVSGGSEQVRFFASGNMSNEVGPIQMPGYEVQRFDKSGVNVRDEWFHPLAQSQDNFRTNFSASVSPKLDLTANAGFTKSDNRIEPESSLIIALLYTGMQNYGFKGPGLDKVVNQADGTFLNDYLQWAPGDIMQYTNETDVQRTLGSFQATWRPLSWMSNEGTVGMDLAGADYFHICRLNECPPQSQTARIGNVQDQRMNSRNFSAKLVSTSSWNAKTWANLKTTFGADYVNQEVDSANVQGRGLPPGATTVAAASTFLNISQTQPTATKTLGLYAQEQVALRDRLFLTVAARTDQNSAFGTNFQRVVYPKASVSWLISDESFFPKYSWLDQFRLRSSYGASGVQPGRTQGLVQFTPASVTVDSRSSTSGSDVPGLTSSYPGNSNLKPERSTETEAGFDTQVLDNRIHIEYTYYNKRTNDALINVPLAPSAGISVTSLLQNIGSTRNSGHELSLTAQLLDRRELGWDVTVNASRNTAIVVNLGTDPATGLARVIGAGLQTEQHNGQPIDAQWYHPYTFHDDNGDGILQRSEVHVDSSLASFGTPIPRDLISVQSGFDLFNHMLRLQGLFDYKGGYSTQDGADNFQCNSTPQSCRETQDPSAPLWEQARAIAKTYGTVVNGVSYKSGAGYFMNGQFWRWREASAALQLPQRVTNLLRAQSGSNLVFAARNLHLWTSFTGLDPEANYGVNGSEFQNEFQTAAAPSYFTLRLNLKY